jgi:sec-independent protein translocase protein TatA
MGVTMPLAIFNLNMPELLVIGLVGILLFGRRLPEMGKSLGKTIVEFKKGLNSTGDDLNKAINEDPEPQPSRRVEARPARPVKQIAGGTDEP